jgi:hypothetical protein
VSVTTVCDVAIQARNLAGNNAEYSEKVVDQALPIGFQVSILPMENPTVLAHG